MAKLFFTSLCLTLVALNASLSNAEETRIQLDQQLDPVYQEQLSSGGVEGDVDKADREKRLGILKKIGIKAGLLDFVFGKIDSFIDAKYHYVNELDKQNIYKNHKYYGLAYPQSKVYYPGPLVSNLINVKANLLGSALSSLLQSKLSHVSTAHVSHPGPTYIPPVNHVPSVTVHAPYGY